MSPLTNPGRFTIDQAHDYVDGFAGAVRHVSKTTGEAVTGSPLNAMNIEPPFSELHFIDLEGSRVSELRRLAAEDRRVSVHTG